MRISPRPSLFFILLIGRTCAVQAAPPPELTVLRTQYDKVVAERVMAPFEASKADLDGKFVTALDRIADEAKRAGKLEDVLAILEDKKRLAQKFPLPEDDDKTSESLKKLRAIYREQLQKLEDQRTANRQAILPAYTAKLQTLETTLTKADRIDEAKDVRDYRAGLDAGGIPAATTVENKSAPAGDVAAPAPRRKFPPGDDRKAAAWAFEQAAWRVVVKIGDKEVSLKNDVPLPSEPFEIIGIDINQQVPPKKPFKNLDALGGLQKVKWLEIVNAHVEDADADVFASIPTLQRLNFNQCRGKFTGQHLDRLSGLAEFTKINLEACPVSNSGIKALAALKGLKELNLDRTATDDKDLAHLMTMNSLTLLRLAHTKTTSKGIAGLKPLTNLTELGWTPTPKKAVAELREIAEAFPDLTAFELRSNEKLSEEDVSGLAAFPRLKRLYVQNSTASTSVLAAAAKFPVIDYIRLYDTGKLASAAFAPLELNSTITFIQCELCPELTDDVLDHLAKISSLRKVTLSRCNKITDAAIDAFKKTRPEVTVTK